jgi:hypothetical protein
MTKFYLPSGADTFDPRLRAATGIHHPRTHRSTSPFRNKQPNAIIMRGTIMFGFNRLGKMTKCCDSLAGLTDYVFTVTHLHSACMRKAEMKGFDISRNSELFHLLLHFEPLLVLLTNLSTFFIRPVIYNCLDQRTLLSSYIYYHAIIRRVHHHHDLCHSHGTARSWRNMDRSMANILPPSSPR